MIDYFLQIQNYPLLPILIAFAIIFVSVVTIMFGELLIQRTGQINLSIEAMVSGALVSCTLTSYLSESFYYGIASALIVCLLIAIVMSVFCNVFGVNQFLLGLAISLFFATVFITIYAAFGEISVQSYIATFHDDLRYYQESYLQAEIPWWLPNSFVLSTLILVMVASYLLKVSKINRLLKAISENDGNAFNLGISVKRIRIVAWVFGSLLIGLGVVNLFLIDQVGIKVENNYLSGYIISALIIISAYRFWRFLLLSILLAALYLVYFVNPEISFLMQLPLLLLLIIFLIFISNKNQNSLPISERFGINFITEN